MPVRRLRALAALAIALCATSAEAWGPDGHQTVGAIADRLIAGTPAGKQVHALLGDLTLSQASVWADCVRGVDPKQGFRYVSAGKYPECARFETPEGEAGMIDYVRRNDTNCARPPGSGSCHTQYHYTDEPVERTRYHLGDVGTSDVDIVAAITATIRVLEGQPSPAPFDIKDRREALLLLSHFVGDLHQPLHVGAVYLDPKGDVVDPGRGPVDPSTGTRGGNVITALDAASPDKVENFHATWDDIPASFHADHIDAAWLAQARAVPPTRGPVDGWSAQWATETLLQAHEAFRGLTFGPEQDGHWSVRLDRRYDDEMARIKKRQLTEAGARLAQVLEAVFPAATGG